VISRRQRSTAVCVGTLQMPRRPTTHGTLAANPTRVTDLRYDTARGNHRTALVREQTSLRKQFVVQNECFGITRLRCPT
jgi:hypothetical protein